jgi:Fe-S oxidoreductase
LPASAAAERTANVTFHDPCYLGRHNGVLEAPRTAAKAAGAPLIEMPRHGMNSFCCGAGGAQFWKEEEHGSAAVNVTRLTEARDTGAKTLAVGCPFCMQMFKSAEAEVENPPEIKDIAVMIAARLPEAKSAAAD